MRNLDFSFVVDVVTQQVAHWSASWLDFLEDESGSLGGGPPTAVYYARNKATLHIIHVEL